MSFNEVLESVEKMPLEDQEMLIDVLRRRHIERRRAELARDVAEANREFEAGLAKPCTAESLMREIVHETTALLHEAIRARPEEVCEETRRPARAHSKRARKPSS